MYLIVQHNKPDDFVVATGETRSVREFVELTFQHLDMHIEWKGEGVDEKGYDKKTGKCLIEIDPAYFRPTEVDLLLGDPTKAKKELNWTPKTTFAQLVEMMCKADYDLAKKK